MIKYNCIIMDKKIIQLPIENNKNAKPSEKKRRQVAEKDDWNPNIEVMRVLLQLKDNVPDNDDETAIMKELQSKLSSYKTQDKKKKLFDNNKIISLKQIIDKLIDCELCCFYCKEKVKLVYEYIREPLQWSLDRLDNDYGHNYDNIVISCYLCNVNRKTMHFERYKFTKELVLVKKEESV
tara:strand:- start:9 stop:548 length:540 start_codon:yes stop_codon:yes gene_type:complete